MTQADLISSPDRPGPRSAAGQAARFEAARRHSRRVSRLKLSILALCGLSFVGLAAAMLFNPFRRIPADISIAGAALNGTKVTIQHPKLTGFRRDGRPYELLAASGVQDVKRPSIVELRDIEAKVTMPDNSMLRLRAPDAVYDSIKDRMSIAHDVRVTSTAGYQARLKSADLDFKAGTIVSKDPVTVTTSNSTIAADRLSISGNGSDILFSGDVRSRMAASGGSDER